MAKREWRKVVGHARYRFHSAHGDTLILKLECGHEVGRKGAQGIPAKVACNQCEHSA